MQRLRKFRAPLGSHRGKINGHHEDERDREAQTDAGEKKDGGNQPRPVGFWDPGLKHVRREAALKWLITTVMLMAFILAVLSIYWAVFFRVDANISSLVVYIVDFDGQPPYDDVSPLVGPTIVRLAEQMVQHKPPVGTLGFGALPPSHFNNDPIAVRQAVYDWDAWAAIIINPNATSMLYSAIQNGNASYQPLGACQLIYQDARDDTNWYDFILPVLSQFMTEATTMVGQEWARTVFQNISDSAVQAGVRAAPQAVSPAIGFSMYNLRPFYPYTSIPAVSIGLIYLIIMSFFSFSFYLPIHFKYLNPKGHPPLKFWQLILWRYLTTLTAYLFLSLAYSLVSLAFQINFHGGNPVRSQTEPTDIMYGNPTAYGKGTFPVYWMLNFWGMIALGLACENMAMFIGMPWMGLWLIFWVITNVSTSFYDIDIEPRFYYWGHAFPLHQIVEGSRQILFDLHSRIGLNFGILVTWGAVNTALFPFACYFMRWKNAKGVTEYWTQN